MEAVGLAASIIAIIQLSSKLVSITYNYISDSQKAPRDVKNLANELHTLVGVLDNLKDYLDENPSSPALQKLVGKGGPIQVFTEEMNALYRKFSAIDSSKLTAKLGWPLKDKDITQTLSSIERHKTVFIFAMNVDQLSLSRAIEAYVIDIDDAVKYINACIQGTSSAVQEIKEDVKNTTSTVQEIKEDVKNTAATVQEIKSDVGGTNVAIQALQSTQDAEDRIKILNWLYPESFETRHLEISGRRREKTGEWLLKSAEFVEFVRNNQSSPILWGHGIPGAGKTFLSSAVIDHLQTEARKNNYMVSYIYFNYKEQKQQKPLQILASLVKQLACQTSQLPSYIVDLHTRLTKETKQPTEQELYSALVSTLKAFGRVFFVFDALDECHQTDRRTTLLPLFHRMVGENPSIRIFLTSRQHPEDIQASFEKSAKVELRANDEDIKLYIQQEINENPRAKSLTSKGDRLNTIISKLTKAANGMFLLVHFHIDLICQQTTPRKLMAELERLTLDGSRPESNPLDPTYNRAIESIRSQPANFELAKSVFTWLVKAQRTLSLDELQIAVSMEPGIRELEEADLPNKKTLLDACAGLVIIDEKSGIVRLAHYTVQEYLLRVLLIPEEANLYIATSSISFLMLDIFGGKANVNWPEYDIFGRKAKVNYWEYDDFGSKVKVNRKYKISGSETIFQWPEHDSPFLEYVVMQLPFHLRHCDEKSTTEPILKLFGDQKRVEFYSRTRNLYLKARMGTVYGWSYGAPIPKQSQLQLLSIIGHFSALRIVLEQKDDVMTRCDKYHGYTALHYAVNEAHIEVARLLIDHGADVSARDSGQKTPLHEALERGHLEIARLLIDHGADVSAKSSYQSTPLHEAAEEGYLEIARLLIDHGADVSARDSGQRTPLHEAAERGHLEVARLLIDHGANVSASTSGWTNGTLLHVAAAMGHLEVARLLIDRGADVSARDSGQRTPLHEAAVMGHLELARLLIDHGAVVSAKDSGQKTPLHEAAVMGHLEVARLLIDHGADVSAKGSSQRTPLHGAAKRGHLEIARLLIDHGADVSAKGSYQKTPLHKALESGHLEIARLLIDHGADVSARDSDQKTPLHEAAEEGYLEIARLLIDHGADVSAKNSEQETPLHKALERGHLEIARLLIDHGADVSARDSDQKTPLHEAAEEGYLEIARLLIDHGADVSAKNSEQETPLHKALERGHLEIARLLIDHGADVSAKNSDQKTPLHQAAYRGYLEIARLLIDHGVDVSAKNSYQRTPLHEAAEMGHLEVARLLIDHGADISARDSDQKTPLQLAEMGRSYQTFRFLESCVERLPVSTKCLVHDTQHNSTRKRERPEESEQLEARKRRALLENRPSLEGQSSDTLPSIDSVMDMGL
ncbi:uncharacterized protein H6S33_001064 [Morchella sextelata]|uniref:uncharacterized protein n=1 Tax=Morchella sextelata TaxID=1174677 RepID=UPI001D041669|nr:uncharacterized protein H6S33_001064 [Morchella sextelata]KAH0608836.1 hypothetical protein H6S33_001064 [Morchella sextelata]